MYSINAFICIIIPKMSSIIGGKFKVKCMQAITLFAQTYSSATTLRIAFIRSAGQSSVTTAVLRYRGMLSTDSASPPPSLPPPPPPPFFSLSFSFIPPLLGLWSMLEGGAKAEFETIFSRNGNLSSMVIFLQHPCKERPY